MKMLEGILSGTKRYYLREYERIAKRLSRLPRGTVKKRYISSRPYYYLQYRSGKRVIHTYLGKTISQRLRLQIRERITLSREARRIKESLRVLRRYH